MALLSPYGVLASLRILPQSPERSQGVGGNVNRGVAFARYQRLEEAERAMEALNGAGRGEGAKGLTVKWATHNKGKDTAGLTTSPRVGPVEEVVGWGYGQSPMSPTFGDYGAAMMMAGSPSGAMGMGGDSGAMYQQGGYTTMDLMALITSSYLPYTSPYQMDSAYLYYAQAAAASLGSPVSAVPSMAPPSPSASPSSPSASLPPPAYLTLFLCHLPPGLSDGGLFGLFSPFGTLTQCRVVRERDGRSKGYGFVSYNSPEECKLAMRAMHGAVVEGRPIKVQWKGDKQSPLTPQHHSGSEGAVSGGGAGAAYNTAGWWGLGAGMGMGSGQPVMA